VAIKKNTFALETKRVATEKLTVETDTWQVYVLQGVSDHVGRHNPYGLEDGGLIRTSS
jgi:hypothetical protein